MVIENLGINTNKFYIPPFALDEREIIVINLLKARDYYDIEKFLIDLLTGRISDKNVIIYKNLTFVENFKESKFRRFFYPVTVDEYLKSNADLNNPLAHKVYDNKWIKEKTNVNTIAGTPRKLLGLYATLSRTKYIVFDLAALDPIGIEHSYGVVKEIIKDGGAAILLDSSGDMKDDCTKYIEVNWKE